MPAHGTGEIKEPSMRSRTKANADHAGLSQPLVLLKVPTRSSTVDSIHSQNNNLLIVIPTVMDAKVDLWKPLSDGLKLTH